VPGASLAEHPRFGKVWPGVLEAINLIGSKQVQGRASPAATCATGPRPPTACPP
jgi:CO/xanthine dehydrogenase FAD-binding subunit